MNSNADENSSNEDQSHNTPISNYESLDRKISASVTQRTIIGPNDVLCGRSKLSFNHSGNRRFRAIVTGALDEYIEATSKWAKSMVAARLVNQITLEGGRFLKQKKGNDDDWYELSTQEAKAKVSHAIRDAISAKDKTKGVGRAISESSSPQKKPAAANTAKRKKQDPTAAGTSWIGHDNNDNKLEQFGITNFPVQAVTGVHASSNQTMASHQASPFALSAMAGPIVNMGGVGGVGGGPHRYVGGTSNVVQDQIQHLRTQRNIQPSDTPPLSYNNNMIGGILGPTGALHVNLNNSASSSSSLLSSLSTTIADRHRQQAASQGLQPPGVFPEQQLAVMGAAQRPERAQQQEAKHIGSGSESEDHDNEFLSLIDSVLGPIHSTPTSPKGKDV